AFAFVVCDNAYACHDPQRGEETFAPLSLVFIASWFFEGVNSANRQSIVSFEQLTTIEQQRNDEDERRIVRHDVLRDRQTEHHEQQHVHGYNVGTRRAAQLDGLLTIMRFTHDLELERLERFT